jgi:hypothetical protein
MDPSLALRANRALGGDAREFAGRSAGEELAWQ